MTDPRTQVAVIGAGPIGLAAAAHLLEQGLDPVVLEAGEQVGAAVRKWGHIRLFSPWRYTLDESAVRLLEAEGWTAPRLGALPTGAELVEQYLVPLASTAALRDRIRFSHRVGRIRREGEDLLVEHEDDGAPLRVRAVVDASGTWGSPAGLGPEDEPLPGEASAERDGRVLGALPDVLGADREQLSGRRVLVAGAGHSAMNTLLNLAELRREEPATRILWAIRRGSPEHAYGGGDRDELPARGALGDRLRRLVEAGEIELLTSAQAAALEDSAEALTVRFADGRAQEVDVVVAATGFRPELEMLRGLRLDVDPAVEAPRQLAPLIDPHLHSCGSVPAHGAEILAHPEAGLFIAGMKSYGRAPTFLMATGYEQVRSIAAHLAGNDAAPRQLDLPETGVCGGVPEVEPVAVSSAGPTTSAESCCATSS